MNSEELDLSMFGIGIRQELVEKSRCPKCFSDKCKAKDLLPNISLRQAIEHFLESQMLMAGSEDAFNKYAPGTIFTPLVVKQIWKVEKIIVLFILIILLH